MLNYLLLTPAADTIAKLASQYASCLYLCPDVDGDSGAPNGFADVKAAFKSAAHTPLLLSSPAFQPGAASEACLEAFAPYAMALDSLPRPTLVMCKSSRRAGAVLSAYRAVKAGLTADAALAQAGELGLSFTGVAGLASWMSTVVSSAASRSPLLFRQMFEKESSTYTYILADSISKDAVIIDPVVETTER